jgi:hypothetical protein
MLDEEGGLRRRIDSQGPDIAVLAGIIPGNAVDHCPVVELLQLVVDVALFRKDSFRSCGEVQHRDVAVTHQSAVDTLFVGDPGSVRRN